MSEFINSKDYKVLYEKSLLKRKKLQKQNLRQKNIIEDLQTEMYSCDSEPIKGELLGRKLGILEFNNKLYVEVEVGFLISNFENLSSEIDFSKKFHLLLKTDNLKKPIPSYCTMDLPDFVIARSNEPRFILNPSNEELPHILIHGNLSWWECFQEKYISKPQIIHDYTYLHKCNMLTLSKIMSITEDV